MTNTVYDKTEKGREEITTRQYRLAPRLRTMLLLFDGKSTAEQVLLKVAGLGLDAHGIAELLDMEFIHELTAATQAVEAGIAAIIQTPMPTPDAAQPEPAHTDLEYAAAQPVPGLYAEGENQFQTLYNFYNTTIKSTIGLRGYAMQLKVERATSIDDFRALRESYVAAVLKARGPEMARSLSDRLDQLLK
ncbi:hypothetical protein RCH09_003679 [Actimicrobium sp. GrIS 1.19]|uniref:hypothetical protein n=1 Tax=Actimicrobium sp. GrIS 1.19 TaxID=3071708 RepID=UPI002E0B8354|nr:hypothetical protein [Actimicrobium sp. GrIS 1.19]